MVYAPCSQAKMIKTHLEEIGGIHKGFRMVCLGARVAIPLSEGFSEKDAVSDPVLASLGTLEFGKERCPFSSAVLGNQRIPTFHPDSNPTMKNWSLCQIALLNVLRHHLPDVEITSDHRERINSVSNTVCPKSLERLGDDRTVVLPQQALNPVAAEDTVFYSWFYRTCSRGGTSLLLDQLWLEVWKEIAHLAESSRVVRKDSIDPDSGIRESGYTILWPGSFPITIEPGPSSPGWITVTEQGIRQSFDLTRVMFSRGNISEKIRFGRLVQKGEKVLDLYAGIGYFTLPALVLGKAEMVVACEWNPVAAQCLRFNLKDNNVFDRATVLEGDCRVTVAERNLWGVFDRVSLGLLPSSEGGWETAVRALNRSKGGWLHVHGNVVSSEVCLWMLWISRVLKQMLSKTDPDVVVVVSHLERVKSFAPTVNHYVADVLLAPRGEVAKRLLNVDIASGTTGVLQANGTVLQAPDRITPPSCALGDKGVLHQAWMR